MFQRKVRFTQTVREAPVQIVCGDCGSDDPVARVTLLARRSGRSCCESCGGGSFILRSDLSPKLQKALVDLEIARLEAEARVE